ncbi:hypothetical protein LJB88_01715 [Erysipelotrichaceae bacterium OttesenSCG-928-M19]|nr:hypothetical protein [Erysipelotrichaceae bacterium OttesenSCG-928-M19]
MQENKYYRIIDLIKISRDFKNDIEYISLLCDDESYLNTEIMIDYKKNDVKLVSNLTGLNIDTLHNNYPLEPINYREQVYLEQLQRIYFGFVDHYFEFNDLEFDINVYYVDCQKEIDKLNKIRLEIEQFENDNIIIDQYYDFEATITNNKIKLNSNQQKIIETHRELEYKYDDISNAMFQKFFDKTLFN